MPEDIKQKTKGELALDYLREKRKNLGARMKARETQQRVNDAGMSALGAIAGAIVPAYIVASNPQREYLDKNRTIETEAVLAAVGVVGGIAAYVADVDYATPIMVTGVSVGASYLGKVARDRARRNLAASP